MTTTLVTKNAHQLRAGDIVHMHGGRFLVTSDLHLSNSHQPRGYWPADSIGPSDCVCAEGLCLEGEVPGYFKPGTVWNFQGNHLATWRVEA